MHHPRDAMMFSELFGRGDTLARGGTRAVLVGVDETAGDTPRMLRLAI